ncbi:hypothetical protein ACOME3_001439 [Neoechinorhynchus agilis]
MMHQPSHIRSYAGPNGEKISVSNEPMPPYVPMRRKPLIQRQVIRLKTPEPVRRTVRRRLPTPEPHTKVITKIITNQHELIDGCYPQVPMQKYDSNASTSTDSSLFKQNRRKYRTQPVHLRQLRSNKSNQSGIRPPPPPPKPERHCYDPISLTNNGRRLIRV